MDSAAYKAECVVLGYILRHPEESCTFLLPGLTHDKFRFSSKGDRFIQEHRDIYTAMVVAWGDGKPPTISVLMGGYLNDSYHPYLQTLYDRLDRLYYIDGYSAVELEGYAKSVDRNGAVTSGLAFLKNKGLLVTSEVELDAYLAGIDSAQAWAADVVDGLSSIVSGHDGSYQSVSEIADEIEERGAFGEETDLLPLGLPSFSENLLGILDYLVVLHGMSSSGKSTLFKIIALGAAIGLVEAGISGTILVHSLDESKSRFVNDLAFLLSGVDPQGLKGQSQENQELFLEAVRYIKTLPILVSDDMSWTVTDMMFSVDAEHKGSNGPVWMFGTDYLQAISGSDWDGGRNYEFLNYVARKHKAMVKRTGASGWLLSQTTYKQGNTDMIGGPSGIRGSEDVRHVADIIYEIYNPEAMRVSGVRFECPSELSSDYFWVLCQKFRGGRNPGNLPLIWDKGRIRDPKLSRTGQDVMYEHLLDKPLADYAPPTDSAFSLFGDD